MPNIKEIALRIGEKADEYADAKLQSKGEFHPDWHTVRDEYFAEALIAELAKQNEPVAWCVGYDDPRMGRIHSNPTMCKPEAEALVKSTTSELIVCSLYALPPTAEQIANETAEAIARMLENGSFLSTESKVALAANGAAKAIRRGAWKEFKK